MNIAICDDTREELERERDIINEVLTEKGIEHCIDLFSSPSELEKSDKLYDIVFLDVEMGNTTGIEVAKRINKEAENCLIFFVTNYETYLDEALNVRAFRFWKKPIDKKKLIYGIDSALKEIEREKKYITVNAYDKEIKIYIKNIIYVNVQNRAVNIVTKKAVFKVINTYKDIYNQLKGFDEFCEICRGKCINFNFVTGYSKTKITCSDENNEYNIDISRRKYKPFLTKFIEWAGGLR